MPIHLADLSVFGASAQFISDISKIKLQPWKDCKYVQTTNVSYQRVLSMCEIKP